MSRFFVHPDEPKGWAGGLARPQHWRPGFSAHALAYTWHRGDGVPPAVAAAFARSGIPAFADVELIVGIPEYKVALPGGDAASQTDLFALLRGAGGETVAVAVEGKVEEPFGDATVGEWRANASSGKEERLRHLTRVLGVSEQAVSDVRYQLVHRTASAVMEAERLGATLAVMLVHSFSRTARWYEHFADLARALGVEPEKNRIVEAASPRGRPLFLGWVSDDLPEVEE